MKKFYPTKSLWGQPTKHKPIYLVGLLWFDRMVHNLSLCAGLPRILLYTDLSSHWPFPVKVYTNPTSLWTIGFMLWKSQLLCGLVDWQNVPTQLLNCILGPSCLFFFLWSGLWWLLVYGGTVQVVYRYFFLYIAYHLFYYIYILSPHDMKPKMRQECRVWWENHDRMCDLAHGNCGMVQCSLTLSRLSPNRSSGELAI